MSTSPVRTLATLLLAAPALLAPTLVATGGGSVPAVTPAHTAAAAAAELPAGGCAEGDTEVVQTPTAPGAGGVAVTAQRLEAGTVGWAEVGWETTTEVEVRTVTAVASDGSTVPLAPAPSGTAREVVALALCVAAPGGGTP